QPRNTKKGMRGAWLFTKEQILVTQTVELMASEQAQDHDKRLIDTVLVRYRIENQDRTPHRVGLRFLLDTLIGANDEPFFTVPGTDSLIDLPRDFDGSVPIFIQALEKPNIKDPGTVTLLNLRPGGRLESPARVSMTHWPGKTARGPFIPLHVPLTKTFQKDSALVLSWHHQDVPPPPRPR